ncbi:cation:proton antiporter subunit C [Corynebacterium atypicum]|uniref:cation:proton antiporter subunit C n=1 Tax=Corynebacterium atypicum TaxID=191610 RepID=UPI0006908B80|nr:cation:proton antiporter subunit C [Corynebacterium atypicum]
MFYALSVAILVFGGVYLIQQRGMVRLVLGMQLIGHAGNLMLLAAGVGAWRGEVFPDRADMAAAADPLPQAFVLTAIVISMATATIMLTMAALDRTDDTVVGDKVAAGSDTRGPDPYPSAMSTLGRAVQTPDEYAAGEKARQAAARRTMIWKEDRR